MPRVIKNPDGISLRKADGGVQSSRSPEAMLEQKGLTLLQYLRLRCAGGGFRHPFRRLSCPAGLGLARMAASISAFRFPHRVDEAVLQKGYSNPASSGTDNSFTHR